MKIKCIEVDWLVPNENISKAIFILTDFEAARFFLIN